MTITIVVREGVFLIGSDLLEAVVTFYFTQQTLAILFLFHICNNIAAVSMT